MMAHRLAPSLCAAALFLVSLSARAETLISFARALALSRERAPQVAVARATESVAEADSRVPGLYPNPTISAGTSTQAARLSMTGSVPLLVLGQRAAALDAGRAEFAVAKLDTRAALAEIRAATGHAFVALWLAERTATARAAASVIAGRLEVAVRGRVELGASPELEGLRVHAERLRAEMDAQAAVDLVEVSAAELAARIGAGFADSVRVSGDPGIPAQVPTMNELWAQLEAAPSLERAAAEERASQARTRRERAQMRPLLTVDLGADLGDPTLPATNYRAQLGIEVPIFNQRGPLIEREGRRIALARSQMNAERVRLSSALIASYRSFFALTRRVQTLSSEVVPAAARAARATEESYSLGRAALVAVLDAERARVDAELALVESQGARANAWIDVELSLGVQ